MEKNLIILGIFLCVGLAIKLWHSGLVSQYKGLFIYAIFSAIRVFVPLLFEWKQTSSIYAYWWLGTEVASWVIYVVLVLELYSAIFHQFPALASFGRKLFQVAIGVSVLVGLGGMFLFASHPSQFPLLDGVLVTRRVVMTSLLIFLICLLFSLSWFRIRLKPNTIVHTVIFFIYFLSKAGFVLVLQILGLNVLSFLNLALLAISNLSILAWAVFLTQRGESTEVVVGHNWNPEKGKRLAEQLAALNSSLARTNQSGSPSGVHSSVREKTNI